MFQQYWQTRAETQKEIDELFYATFPAAREAAFNDLFERRVCGLPDQYSSEPTSLHIPQSQSCSVPAREPIYLDYQPSNILPQVTTDILETDVNNHTLSPRHSFQQLNRQVKPPISIFSNDYQLGVTGMRLDRLPDRSDLDSPQLSRSHPSPSEASPVTSCPSTTPPGPPIKFLLESSPTVGFSYLTSSSKNILEKKPLACLFCRGRKIACGAPLPGIKKMCNQCRKRGLTCYYPTERRRGVRKKKPPSDNAQVTTKRKKKKEKKE